MADFKITSFNCKNFNGVLKLNYISELFESCDVLLLQEHHLYCTEFDKFGKLLENCTVLYEGTSAMDSSCIKQGRKYGGTAILWRGSIKYKMSPICTTSDRLSCVEICLNADVSVLLFCVYMPCDNRAQGINYAVYQDILAEISHLCQVRGNNYVIIAGDLNTDLSRNTYFSHELQQFCNNEDFCTLTCSDLCDFSYTFESAMGSRSLIDHVIVSKNLLSCVERYNTHDSVDNTSDHLPVTANFNFICEYLLCDNVVNEKSTKAAWYKASVNNISSYKDHLDKYLSKNGANFDVFSCKQNACSNKLHIDEIDLIHKQIVDACVEASKRSIPSIVCGDKVVVNTNSRSMPGFNEYVRELRSIALHWHWVWKWYGRPRHGYYADMRRFARARYHYCVRSVKRNEMKIRSERMAQAIATSDHRNLWSEVKRVRGKGNKLPKVVDGLNDPVSVSEMFATKFKTLYNSVGYNQEVLNDIEGTVSNRIENMTYTDVCDTLFSFTDVNKAVEHLKCNKSDGVSGIYSDHFVHGTPSLFDLITKYCNAVLLHGYCPADMLQGSYIPIPKNKRCNSNCSDNFRAICLQSILCKLIDIVIIQKQSDKLVTSDLQFSYKSKLSTHIAVSVFQETVEYYVNGGSNVYALALDASKAFDRVRFDKLFALLIERDVNPIYIRLLIKMYCNQKLRVCYNRKASSWFTITNGVKQGGVLSPTLFCLYVDGLLEKLRNSGVGCCIGRNFVGSIGYADDLLLLTPTVSSLKAMIRICEQYAIDYDIKFNGSKSQLMVFGKHKADCVFHVFGEKVAIVNEMKYLGYHIVSDCTKSMVKPVVNDFSCKFNTFIAYFDEIKSEVKNNLFKQYCTSFYGHLNCALYEDSIEDLNKAVRKAIRRVWRLPYRSHSSLLPHIADFKPCHITLWKRFVSHFHSGCKNENKTVSDIFRYSLFGMSRLSKNYKFVIKKISDFLSGCKDISNINCNSIKSAIDRYWFSTCSFEDIRNANHIKELCLDRDTHCDSFMKKNEICEIIEYLCTL